MIRGPIEFTDYIFLIVLIISLFIYWSLKNYRKIQNICLLLICYFIYAFANLYLLITILISTIFNYSSGIFIEKSSNLRIKQLILTSSIIANILYLFVFKYFNFFIESISKLLSIIGFTVNVIFLNLILPLGISFYTLQVIAYNIDVYNEKIKSTKNFISFAIYVAYFPKIAAGPIEKPGNFLPQLETKKSLKKTDFTGSFRLLLLGYFKKIVIADVIAHMISDFYVNPNNYSSLDAKFIVILFTIQIYADFSAYSDLARGISKLFGIELMINFNQPYLSTNIRDFWRRWHISLMQWFRDYIYIPLGGNRKGFLRLTLNLLIIFIVSGIWHGVGINFIIWGFLHFLFMISYKLCSNLANICNLNRIFTFNNENKRYKYLTYLYKFFGWFITFQLVNFAWIFFRAPDFETAILIIKQVYFTEFDLDLIGNIYFYLLIYLSIFIMIIDIAQFRLKSHDIFSNLHWIIRGLIYAFLIFMILTYSNIFIEIEPFIYRGF